MTSPLPPKRRNTRNLEDLIRQDRTRLGQLDRGLVGGRVPTLRPLKATWDDDGEDDELVDEIAFINTDRAATTTAGQIRLGLTYLPIDGSLHIRWNGIDQPPTEWSLNDRLVTFTNVHVHAGDVLTAAYAYYPEDADAAVLDGLVLRGTTTRTGALPSATQIGDFVIIATRGAAGTHDPVFTDPRFPLLSTPGTEGQVYAGIATDLSTLAPASGLGAMVVVAAFVGRATVSAVGYDYDPPSGLSVAAMSGNAAVAVINERSSFVAGSISLPNMPPWVMAATDVQAPGWTQLSVLYWYDGTATTTPAVTPNTSGGIDETEAFIITLQGVGE